MSWYLIRREYRYHTQEWVEASNSKSARAIGATENEDVHHDDTWIESLVIDISEEDPGEEIRAQGIKRQEER